MAKKMQATNGHRPTTRLFPFKQYWTFQGYYKVKASGESELSVNDVFNKCILHIIDWLKVRTESDRKKNEQLREELSFINWYPSPLEHHTFELFGDEEKTVYQQAKRNYDISIFAYKDEETWTIRIIEPNSKRKNGDRTRKRLKREQVFITNAAVKKTSEGVYLTSRITCKEPADNKEKSEECLELKKQKRDLEERYKELEKRLAKYDRRKEIKNKSKSREDYVNKYIEKFEPLPDKVTNVIPWIEEHFSDTITLSKEAVNRYESLGNTKPIDIVCKSFIYLNAVVLLKRNQITLQEFLDIGESDLLSSIHSSSIKELKNKDEIETKLKSGYDNKDLNKLPIAAKIQYGGKMQALNLHIRYGSNSSRATRIYFLYDAEIQKAIVGAMPDHLPDGSSHNTKGNRA